MEQLAKAYAERKHDAVGHRRKHTGDPYITHPAAVAGIVRGVPHTEAMLCAAWLHDTVEDTPATLDDIRAVFGDEVAVLVEMLTNVSKPEDGVRAERKAVDRKHTAKASPQAKTIKLADVIDNAGSIAERDPKFAKVYLAEKALLLEVLKEGDPVLWRAADEVIKKGLDSLVAHP